MYGKLRGSCAATSLMNINQQMFLLAAEELSFSRAAERAFVTPQCLSDHIKRLEAQYQVVLFQRRPKLLLTKEGEIMLRYFKRIQMLEDRMCNELADSKSGLRGTIRFGIPTTRGEIIVPPITTRFRSLFPRVDIQVSFNDTRMLEELLLNGKIDVMIGVDATQHPLFQRVYLHSEPLFLLVTAAAMQRQFGKESVNTLEDFRQNGADLHLMRDIPFVQGYTSSTTTIALMQFLLKENLQLQMPILSSNFDVIANLCATGEYATICSRFYIRQLLDNNGMNSIRFPFCIFPIRGLTEKLKIELISHRDSPKLEYQSVFSKIITETVRYENSVVCSWLTTQGISH